MDEFLAFRNSAQQNQGIPETASTSVKRNWSGATEGKANYINDLLTQGKSDVAVYMTPAAPTTKNSKNVESVGLRQKLSKALKPEENSTLEKLLSSDDLEEANDPAQQKIVVYTDGSSRGNGQANPRAGVGVYWGDNDPRNVSERLEGRQTNQRAEITAALRAIQTSGDDKSVLEIRTDSNYVIQSMTQWVYGWLKKGWKGVTNKDLLQELHTAIQKREGKIIWTHIRGHTGVYGNEMADKLANLGTEKPLLGPSAKRS
ncbi:RnaseH-domain-containing protein [Basidiobolus meristosporus CBS 931.73]|uniref:ribonuclease H n=1 Tax=Basidiobolus meristosporus CBS 931.73 TaxID=1314790 RepID=A0A1Y1XLB4_9FUNG|nr:RnaseH-domain-containing protein [Basidiobolus meristosporus CBS 931.73]|eukprot:ORX86483.1 RnaseH-domain-containing protein [Basidiobolus meristosporus CBS 931.73]